MDQPLYTWNKKIVSWVDSSWWKPSKATQTQQWAGKVMAFVFWNAHGILIVDYLEKGKTINSDYYLALLDRLSAEIKEKRTHMQKKKVLFHQDNTPCHKSIKRMVKLNELSFELLPHPPYSPDLPPATTGQWSQNVGAGGPHHRPHQLMASSSLDWHRLVEWERHNELEASMVGPPVPTFWDHCYWPLGDLEKML